MKLRTVLLEALAEQGEEETIELPNQNFTISVERVKNRLIFSPQGHFSMPSKMRTMLTMLKQKFNVTTIDSLEDEGDTQEGDTDDLNLRGMFEVVFDPRESLDEILDFIKTSM